MMHFVDQVRSVVVISNCESVACGSAAMGPLSVAIASTIDSSICFECVKDNELLDKLIS